MLLETLLEDFPKVIPLKNGLECQLRPLQADDESAFHEFFLAVPEQERLFIKHRVTERELIRDWCQNIDLGRNLPLLALTSGKIVGCSTLHQHLGGWRRHIGRVSVLVHPEYRGRGVARSLVKEIIEMAHQTGLERIEAEFVAEQEAAMKVFGLLGFTSLVRLPGYVKDMQATPHDYVLTALDLPTDEEYAGAG